MDTPVANYNPEEGAPESLETRGDGRGNTPRHPVTNQRVHTYTYTPPQPITPIQAVLARRTRDTNPQPGLSTMSTLSANEPNLPQRVRTSYSSTQHAQNADTRSSNASDVRHHQPRRAPVASRRHSGIRPSLKVASLNIKGRRSGDIEKWMHIPQIVREKKIGVLAVQETHLTDELAERFNNLFGNNNLLESSPDPSTCNARGIAIVVNKHLINTDKIQTTTVVPGRALVTKIPWHDNQYITILAIYAPNSPREIRDFWTTIQSKLDDDPDLEPDITMGDFNLVEDAIDRMPSRPDDPQTTEILREFKIKHSLIDGWRQANLEEKGYTWSRESDGTQSRIDRIYIREAYFNDCVAWKIEPAPIPTDHDLISAQISTPSTPEIGRGRWAIPPRLIKHREIKKEIQQMSRKLQNDIENLQTRTPQTNPQVILQEFKDKIRETLRKHEKKLQPMITNKIAKLTETLRNTLNNPSLSEDEIRITASHLKKEIQLLNREAHWKNRDTLAAIDAAEGERIGKTWSNRHKENKPRDMIKRIIDPVTNNPTRISKEMARIAANYHEKLQHDGHDPRDQPEHQALEDVLRNVKMKLSKEGKTALSKPISEEEIREAIRITTSEKAPGPDGIPIELWKSLDNQHLATKDGRMEDRCCNIIWVLKQVYRDIEENGVANNTNFHEGYMCPIYKKKDPDNIANYRPITLLNTDYKIFTKALSIRLANVANEIIHNDQAGFIKGRSIFDQVKTTKVVTDYMDRSRKVGAIIALDQEKAYDKILHPYLWAVLRRVEMPESFIKTIQALYDNAKTVVMINGEISKPFTVCRGVRQGDTLSCLLFDIAIEPLAASIRNSPQIKGIPIPGTRKALKVKLFADDTTVYLSEKDNIADLQEVLTKWCKVSGAKFNIEKTEIIPLVRADLN